MCLKLYLLYIGSKKLSALEKDQSLYSKMYIATAVMNLVAWFILSSEKCVMLARMNVFFAVFYLIVGFKAMKAESFKGIFDAVGIVIILSVVLHTAKLGMGCGYQYLLLGAVPVVFYMAYIGDSVAYKRALLSSVLLLVVFETMTVLDYTNVFNHYNISDRSLRILNMINIAISFGFAVTFMIKLYDQALSDKGLLKNKNENLEMSASVDTLTGLRNRRTIDAYMDKALYRARGEDVDFSIFMCDLDNFKRINDTYGHDCGDLVLKNVARVIQEEIRPDDIVFRFGGEEILMIISAKAHIAKKVAERCRAAIEASSVEYRGENIKVTMTFGGASYYQGVTKETMIKRADANLYEGKSNGKNQVVM